MRIFCYEIQVPEDGEVFPFKNGFGPVVEEYCRSFAVNQGWQTRFIEYRPDGIYDLNGDKVDVSREEKQAQLARILASPTVQETSNAKD